MPGKFTARNGSLAAFAAIGGALAMPMPAFGQAVSDRTLNDVKVDRAGGCTALTVNFNIRVQMLSYFPTSGGRELHIRVRPLDTANINALRESLRTPTSVPSVRSIEYEADNPSGPTLSLFFTRDMRFEVAAGAQPQAIVIKLAEPGTGAVCAAPMSEAPQLPPPLAPEALPESAPSASPVAAAGASRDPGSRRPLCDQCPCPGQVRSANSADPRRTPYPAWSPTKPASSATPSNGTACAPVFSKRGPRPTPRGPGCSCNFPKPLSSR